MPRDWNVTIYYYLQQKVHCICTVTVTLNLDHRKMRSARNKLFSKIWTHPSIIEGVSGKWGQVTFLMSLFMLYFSGNNCPL